MTVSLWPKISSEIVDLLCRRFKKRRFHHVLGTLHTAMGLADCHGVSSEKAAWAALLHDIWKIRDPEAERIQAEELGETIPKMDAPHPGLWHAWAAAGEARKTYGIEDLEILEAIRFHSTGCAGMGDICKIMVCTDYLEPTRGLNGRQEILDLARRDLDAACAAVLRSKIAHMEGREKEIHPRALAALESLTPSEKEK